MYTELTGGVALAEDGQGEFGEGDEEPMRQQLVEHARVLTSVGRVPDSRHE
jgi:hypothetical protein